MTSWTELAARKAKPVELAAVTSLWSPKMDRACAASERVSWRVDTDWFAAHGVQLQLR